MKTPISQSSASMGSWMKPEGAIASASMEDIDDTLLIEVLCRGIPNFRFGLQCKLVSKRWRDLISHPIFIKRWKECHKTHHRNNEPKPFALVINHRIRPGEDKYMINYVASNKSSLFPFPRFKLDFLPCGIPRKAASIRIAASCNDLFLCHAIGHKMDLEKRVYYICNPLTKDWVGIPPFPTKFPFIKGVATGLVCDGKSYRVVRFHGERSPSFIAEVFSSDTNKWEEFQLRHPDNKDFLFEFSDYRYGRKYSYTTCAVFCCNGILLLENKMDDTIVVYNPWEPEKCHIIDTPRERLGQYCRDYIIFGMCNGSFRLVQHYDHPGGRHGLFRIWELEDYYGEGEWIFKNEIVFRDFITDDGPLRRQCEMNSDDESDFDDYVSQIGFFFGPRIMVLAVDPNDEDTLYFYHKAELHKDRRIFSCNLETKEVEVFDKTIIERSVDGWLRNIFQFVVPDWPTPIPRIAHST